MKKALNNFRSVALDTNIFLYHFNSDSPFHNQSEKIFKLIVENNISMSTSILTLTELLSFGAPQSILEKLENEFLSIPNLSILEVDRVISEEAASIRRENKFRLPDAIQLATAILSKAEVFITNDERLKNFKKVKITRPQELLKSLFESQ